jgi:hypothetical protein
VKSRGIILLLVLISGGAAQAQAGPVSIVLSFRPDEGNRYTVGERVAYAFGIPVPQAGSGSVVAISKGSGVSEVRWSIRDCNGSVRVLKWLVDPARGHLEPEDRATAVLSGLRFGGDPSY